MLLSRRQVLKLWGSTLATLAVGQSTSRMAVASSTEATDSVGMLIDVTRCVGCGTCQRACQQANNLPAVDPVAGANPSHPVRLSANTWTIVEGHDVPLPGGQSEHRWVKRQCMHCLDPACVSACPVAALYKTAEGPVIYRGERCIGCRYCMVACPFEIPKFQWDSALPIIRKCQLCAGRLNAGQLPACVQACPTGALLFGRREELLGLAKSRIQAHPDHYIDRIYGEAEVGGTSVLYLSDVSFEKLGFRTDLSHEALPMRTYEVISKIPPLVVGLALTLGGVSFATHRRMHPSEEE
jgi:formate dehydrogenase iron-sulfur subunit